MSFARVLGLRAVFAVRRPVANVWAFERSWTSGGGKEVDVLKNYEAKLSEKERAFDKEFVIPGAEADRGVERLEREAREKMRRVPRHQGDFSTLEEKHVLYGARGTIDNPVKVESIYPSRIVGCFGSSETHEHDLLWHVVKRERPTVCLECGQVFQLALPPGEKLHARHHHDDGHGHGHDSHGAAAHGDAHGHAPQKAAHH